MKRAFFAAVLAAVVLLAYGCADSNFVAENPMPSVTAAPTAVPATSTPTPTPEPTATPTPTPTPEPTPIIDMLSSANEPVARSDEDMIPLLTESFYVEGNLNPFFCSDELDCEMVDYTQLPLLYINEEGEAEAGIDKPCLAYSIEKMPDSSQFMDGTSDCGDEYDCYRIVLKEGIAFSDGTPVTIDDALFSAYTLADKSYKGYSTLSEMDIFGMKEYHTQVPKDVRAQAEKALAGGIDANGDMPWSCNMQPARWREVWQHYDEAGIRMAQDIIDYVNEKYAIDAYVNAFFSTNLTYGHIAADENLKVAYAMRIWGYAKSFKTSNYVLKDCFDVEHNLKEESISAETFWGLMKQKYGYDVSYNTGLMTETVDYNEKTFEDYIADIFYADKLGVESITGIEAATQEYDDGAVRSAIDVLIHKDTNIADFNFYVAEKSFYENDLHSTEAHGAGAYVVVSCDDETAILEANPGYLMGEPARKTIVYGYLPEEEAEEDSAAEAGEGENGDSVTDSSN